MSPIKEGALQKAAIRPKKRNGPTMTESCDRDRCISPLSPHASGPVPISGHLALVPVSENKKKLLWSLACGCPQPSEPRACCCLQVFSHARFLAARFMGALGAAETCRVSQGVCDHTKSRELGSKSGFIPPFGKIDGVFALTIPVTTWACGWLPVAPISKVLAKPGS